MELQNRRFFGMRYQLLTALHVCEAWGVGYRGVIHSHLVKAEPKRVTAMICCKLDVLSIQDLLLVGGFFFGREI